MTEQEREYVTILETFVNNLNCGCSIELKKRLESLRKDMASNANT